MLMHLNLQATSTVSKFISFLSFLSSSVVCAVLTSQFLNCIDSFNLRQSIKGASRSKGHSTDPVVCWLHFGGFQFAWSVCHWPQSFVIKVESLVKFTTHLWGLGVTPKYISDLLTWFVPCWSLRCGFWLFQYFWGFHSVGSHTLWRKVLNTCSEPAVRRHFVYLNEGGDLTACVVFWVSDFPHWTVLQKMWTMSPFHQRPPTRERCTHFLLCCLFFSFCAAAAGSRRAAGASSSLHGALLHNALLPEAAVGGFRHLHLLWQLPLQTWLRWVTPGL